MLITSSLYGQTRDENPLHTLYIKLERPVDIDSGIFASIHEKFSVTAGKQELLSKVLKGNVYSIRSGKENILKIKAFLKDQKGVLYTSIYKHKFIPPPSDIPPTTTDFTLSQGYIEEDPGVNAVYAWDNGADGSGITVRAIEYGIDLDHEEFVGRAASIAANMSISSEADFVYTTHGTATAGVVYSHNGTYGTTGIAHNASAYILYPEWQEGMEWNRIDAITNAVNDGIAGDILIYEMQIDDPNGAFVPAEYDQLVWDLTKTATLKGLVVVAAAGNGGVNLDTPLHDSYNARGDSGAIIVGAGTSTVNHDTHSGSTYGTRVNVQAWGENVFTTGYGGIQFANDVHQYYTDSYGGTSSATAIVGGCAALLQSYYFSMTNSYMTSIQMRELLINTGIPQVNMSAPIGPFPDLRKAMEAIDVSLSLKNEDQIVVNVYPNPVSDLLIIKQVTSEPKLVTIYNVLGQELFKTTIDKDRNTVSLGHLNTGIYYVRIAFDNLITTKRVLKK